VIYVTLTDLHTSNIFVDENWQLRYLVDLEWSCSLPIEMQLPPYWLTDQPVDRLTEQELATFSSAFEEFVSVFENEERILSP